MKMTVGKGHRLEKALVKYPRFRLASQWVGVCLSLRKDKAGDEGAWVEHLLCMQKDPGSFSGISS